MNSLRTVTLNFALTLSLGIFLLADANGASFSVSYTDGGSWSTIYAQGFSPALEASPDPGLSGSDTVQLDSFSFYKSGSSDSATDIRLAIIDSLFADLTSLTDGSSPVLALSDNTVANTASHAEGDAIAFSFTGVELDYTGDYAAVFVTEGIGGELTPVLVSSQTANYVDNGTGTFVPETNYGTETEFQYAVSNFISTDAFGSYFNTFSYAADANFEAVFTTVPEPSSLILLAAAASLSLVRRSR